MNKRDFLQNIKILPTPYFLNASVHVTKKYVTYNILLQF